jgi:glycosyltransferase involved in cell wall biosynthesis
MRVVFITQHVDPDHPVLAATLAKIAALAERADVSVLALGALPGAVPATVRMFGARTKAGRGLRFLRALRAELRTRPDLVIAHMCPIYAVLAAPLVRPRGIRLSLWYTHWRATPTLRLAEKLVDEVTSVDRRSFPLESAKVRAIGHGIDLAEIPCRDGGAHTALRVLALGRYSSAKGLDLVLRGLRLALDAGVDARFVAYGPASAEHEAAHKRELEGLVRELALEERVRLEGPVPRVEIPRLFGEADVLVNNMRAGAPDKVVYEAGAGCLPVIASNPVFDELLPEELRFDRESPDALAERLDAFARLDADARAAIGRELRARVAARHSVGSWADAMLRTT